MRGVINGTKQVRLIHGVPTETGRQPSPSKVYEQSIRVFRRDFVRRLHESLGWPIPKSLLGEEERISYGGREIPSSD